MQDNQLTRLSRYINRGFLCEKKNLPIDLQDYWNYQDTLSIENGLLTCGSRIIVPHEMQAEMLQYIHEGHQAVCAEIATIVAELGLPHVIRSDNGPCYNSKEFQQMLQ